jgi:hypothetical protein
MFTPKYKITKRNNVYYIWERRFFFFWSVMNIRCISAEYAKEAIEIMKRYERKDTLVQYL